MTTKTVTIKRLIIIPIIILFTYSTWAQSIDVNDVEISRKGKLLTVGFNIETPQGLDANREITYIPVLRSATGKDSLKLPEGRVAGRNRYYTLLRNRATADNLTLAGKGMKLSYENTIDYQPWMEHSTLNVRLEEKGCCGKPAQNSEKLLVTLDYTPRKFQPVYQYMRPVPDPNEDRVKSRSLSGKAYIDFRVNRTDIDPTYSDNSRELASIDRTIDSVKLDRDITIDSIHIRGYASPEGSYSNISRLAKGRTASLVAYVEKLHSFPHGIIHSSYEPEDWEGLARALEAMTFDNKRQVMELVTDSRLAPDTREAKFRETYPQTYAAVREMIYPKLRHSDYRIHYRVRSFNNPSEIVGIAKNAPTKLSYNEICTASESFEQGSKDYATLWENAARLFPESTVAKVNAANCAMADGRLFIAHSLLEEADPESPEVIYAKGNLAALQGDRDKARELFTRAARMQVSDAPEALRRLNELPDWD